MANGGQFDAWQVMVSLNNGNYTQVKDQIGWCVSWMDDVAYWHFQNYDQMIQIVDRVLMYTPLANQ